MNFLSKTHNMRMFRFILLVIVIGFSFGMLTAYGQAFLPNSLTSLANSSGSWSMLAFLIALRAHNVWISALSGTLTFFALLAGYIISNEIRGYSAGSSLIIFWGVAGVLVGPFLGLSAHWVRRDSSWLAAL